MYLICKNNHITLTPLPPLAPPPLPSHVQPHSSGPASGGHPGGADQTLSGYEQRGLPVHISKCGPFSESTVCMSPEPCPQFVTMSPPKRKLQKMRNFLLPAEGLRRRRLDAPRPNTRESPSDVFQCPLKVQGLFEREVQWHILSPQLALHL